MNILINSELRVKNTYLALLIPVYNNELGLRRSILSIDNSSIKPDIVIVDDGSKKLLDIKELKNLYKSNIVILHNKTNRGIEYALNVGMEYILENGYKYFARLDAGDQIEKDRLEKQINVFEDDTAIGIVGSFVRFVDSKSNKYFNLKLPEKDAEIMRYIMKKPPFIHPAVMLKSELARRIGPYSYDYEGAEDYEYFYRALKNGYKGLNIPELLTICDFNIDGITSKRRNRQLRSIVKIQMRYNPKNIIGRIFILRTILLFMVPYKLLRSFRLR